MKPTNDLHATPDLPATAPAWPIHPDARRSRLRALGAEIDLRVDRLKLAYGDDAGAVVELQTAWKDLVGALDLGPEPVTRLCPKCGAIAMRDASVCGYCWAPLARVEH